MVPVGIEHVRNFLHDGPDSNDVEVTELGILADAEVFICDIAAADDRNLVVDGE